VFVVRREENGWRQLGSALDGSHVSLQLAGDMPLLAWRGPQGLQVLQYGDGPEGTWQPWGALPDLGQGAWATSFVVRGRTAVFGYSRFLPEYKQGQGVLRTRW
jgi:hypothetical protein